MIKYIVAQDAPNPAGHYSQAAWFDGQLFISGQLPIQEDAVQDDALADGFTLQAERALANMINILNACGGSTANLLKVTAYIVGIANWDSFDRIYAKVLGPARPARVIVPVPELHYGYLVEVDAIAAGIEPIALESGDAGGTGPAAGSSR